MRMRDRITGVIDKKDFGRFLSKVKVSENGCWNWIAGVTEDGYGHFWLNGKTVRSHRLAYRMWVGNILDNKIICHHCDNPACVNPKHMFMGTTQDNVTDRETKHRGNHTPPILIGSKHPKSKFIESDIVKIRELRKSGLECSKIALIYGVVRQTIHRICTNNGWKHVENNNQ